MTHISERMNSSRLSTFARASALSCFTRTGPTSLKMSFSGVRVLNSFRCERSAVSGYKGRVKKYRLDRLVLGELRAEPAARVDDFLKLALYLLVRAGRGLQALLGLHRGTRRWRRSELSGCARDPPARAFFELIHGRGNR